MMAAIPIDEFTRHRALLFAIAYRMLGTVADAEDMIQETYLRWQRAAAQGEQIAAPQSWLTTVLTRLCLDQLRSARVRREEYVGPWLPEPILTEVEPDPAEHAALADSLSLAFLVLLENLTPVERAIFLLHDVFDYDYAAIARIVGKSEANCRQLARRARDAVTARRPRFDPSPGEQERLTRQFVAACTDGDLAGLVATLADDITLWADGGGKAHAAMRPVQGADRVARFMLGVVRKAPAGTSYRLATVNAQPAIIASLGGVPFSVLTLDIAGGCVRGISVVANPDKLVYLH